MGKGIINKLNYIKKQLENGEYVEQKPMLSAKVADISEQLRKKELVYSGIKHDVDHPKNFPIYKAWIKKGKHEALADLEELQYLIGKKKTNKQRAIKVIEKIISTNLHQNEVTQTIKTYQSRSRSTCTSSLKTV